MKFDDSITNDVDAKDALHALNGVSNDNLQQIISNIQREASEKILYAIQKNLESEGFEILKFEKNGGDPLDFIYMKITVSYKNKKFDLAMSHSGYTFYTVPNSIVGSGSNGARVLARKLDKLLKK